MNFNISSVFKQYFKSEKGIYIVSEDNPNNIRERNLINYAYNLSLNVDLSEYLFVCFNSRKYFFKILVGRLIFKKVIFDFGYPYSDNTNVSLLRKVLFYTVDKVLLSISTIVFFETVQQRERFKKISSISSVLYAVDPIFFNFSKTNAISKSGCIFNGNHNEESGLKYIESVVINGRQKLFVHSRDTTLTDSCFFKVSKEHLSRTDFVKMLSHFKAQVGQMSSEHKRLQFTIPHKFFDAVSLGQYYISYPYPPILFIVNYFNLNNVIFIENDADFISELSRLHILPELVPNNIIVASNQSTFNSVILDDY